MSHYYYYHNCFTALCPGQPVWAYTRRINRSEYCWSRDDEGGSGNSWIILKSFAPRLVHTDNHANTSLRIFTGRMLLLLPNKQHQTNEGSLYRHTHTQPFNGLFSRTTWVGRYQKDKPFWILLKQEITGWQWHQLNHMQIICTSLQTDNHGSTSSLHIFYRPDALPAAQPTASKH